MRRIALALLLAVLPAALAAQVGPGGRRGGRPGPDEQPADTLPSNATRGFQVGMTTYSGGDFQPSGVDVGLVWRTKGLPFSTVSLGLRAGSFIQNQAVLIGSTRGFFLALLGSARLPVATLWMVGSERNPTMVRLEAVFDLAGSWNANTPMAQGTFSVVAAPLAALSIGGRGPMDQSFLLLVGPAWFGPKSPEWHPQVSLRFTQPLGDRSARRPPPN